MFQGGDEPLQGSCEEFDSLWLHVWQFLEVVLQNLTLKLTLYRRKMFNPVGLIILGVILLVVGILVKAVAVLFTIGLVLAIVGVVWLLVGSFTGRT